MLWCLQELLLKQGRIPHSYYSHWMEIGRELFSLKLSKCEIQFNKLLLNITFAQKKKQFEQTVRANIQL